MLGTAVELLAVEVLVVLASAPVPESDVVVEVEPVQSLEAVDVACAVSVAAVAVDATEAVAVAAAAVADALTVIPADCRASSMSC